MLKSLLIFAMLGAICSCNDDINKVEPHLPSFKLDEDLYDFSNKLENHDTLTLLVDASVCAWWQEDSLVFIKNNDKITLSTTVQIWLSEKEIHKLGTVEYSKTKDSLNFESLFQFVKNKGVKDQEINSSVFTLIYKQDTLHLYSDHLIDHMDNLNYFTEIQRRLYPNAEPYQPVLAPEPE